MGLRLAPFGDGRVVAALQDLRHLAPLPDHGPGVLRMLQKAVREAFLDRRFAVADHSRQEPNGGVDQRHGRDLAPGQDEIAHRDLFDPVMLDHPLVEPLEAAANQRHAFALRIAPRGLLREGLAARGQEDQGTYTLRGLDGALHHVGAQDHARPATRGRVIDVAVLALSERAQADGLKPPEPHVQRLAGQREPERARKGLGEEGDDLDGEGALHRDILHQVARLQRQAHAEAAVRTSLLFHLRQRPRHRRRRRSLRPAGRSSARRCGAFLPAPARRRASGPTSGG